MDTTKEYINRCEKATEIQDMWRLSAYTECDYYFNKKTNKYYGSYHMQTEYDCIWLPRQDQLQEIVYGQNMHTAPLHWIIRQFSQFINYKYLKKGYAYIEQFKSMEQLWLAYVMKEKYNKMWDGKDWVNV